MSRPVGVVLAGGASKRMGRKKSDLRVDGQRLVERAAEVLWPLCSSVLISVAPGESSPIVALDAVQDAAPGRRGPLAGIAAAFAATGQADLLILACDYPYVDETVLRLLLERPALDADLIFPTDPRGWDHPLVGLWMRSAATAVERALEREAYKVRSLLVGMRIERLHPASAATLDWSHLLTNVNRPDDLPGASD